MTMSTESKEVLKNGKSNSPPNSNSAKQQQQQVNNDLTPETSDDDFRKFIVSLILTLLITFISLPTARFEEELKQTEKRKK